MAINGEGKREIIVQWGHIVLALIVYLLSIGVVYGTMRTQLDETTRRVEELEQKTVTREQIDMMREDINRRLQRIEDKLDRDKAMRDIH